MKENKFRAWNSKEKFMDSAWLIDWEHGSVCHGKHNQSELDDCTLMQYTGLKDKNGREIYEGDILELYIPNWAECDDVQRFVVDEFCCDVAYLQAVVKHCEECSLEGENDYIEVIGNVYENPELSEELQNGTN